MAVKNYPALSDKKPPLVIENCPTELVIDCLTECLDHSEVLSSDFPGLKTSAASITSMASTASVASMTSTAIFNQKNY